MKKTKKYLLAAACVSIILAIIWFYFSGDSFSPSPSKETNNLTYNQLEECREKLGINKGVEIQGEYYLFTPGFLDSSLECHIEAKGESLDTIFDLTKVDPHETLSQTLEPGTHVELEVEQLEEGRYLIKGFWFET